MILKGYFNNLEIFILKHNKDVKFKKQYELLH
jgi:hypothetical protein